MVRITAITNPLLLLHDFLLGAAWQQELAIWVGIAMCAVAGFQHLPPYRGKSCIYYR